MRLLGLGGQGVTGWGGLVARAWSALQAWAQGQCVGRCRTSRRPVAAIRAGTWMIWRRRVAHRALARPAATAAARAMLNPITARLTQAALAAYFPDGRWARGRP